jgi:hypothetical protein
MATSTWYLHRTGKLLALTRTQDLLVELAPVVEDMTVACQELRCAVAESVKQRDEARRLIIRARRQRLGLQLAANGQSTAG